MKKKISLITALVLIFNVIYPILSIAAGDNNIYIGTEEELWNFAESVNSGESYLGKTVILTNNIALSCSEEKPWIPIGNQNNAFRGTFDGRGFTISGMYILSSEQEYSGLFGHLNTTKPIKNLTVKDSSIIQDTQISKYIGIIAGAALSIEGCYTQNCTIKISNISNASTSRIGGIIGGNPSAWGGTNKYIKNTGNETNIIITNVDSNSNHTYVGGVIGSVSHGGNIKNCYNKGDISIDSRAAATGGIVGNSYVTVEKCYNKGKITTIGKSLYNATGTGGIVGSNHGIVIESYNVAEISGTEHVGGITGTNFTTSNNVEESYNIGKAMGESNIGGITGTNGSTGNMSTYGATLKNCYNVGEISYTNKNAGNIVGYNKAEGIIENCYYVTSTIEGCGINNSEDIVEIYEKESTQMKESSFVEELNGDITSYAQDSYTNNNGYPILVWITDIEIEQEPEKLMYRQNKEELDLSGGKIKLVYNYEGHNTIIDMDDENVVVEGFDNTEGRNIRLTVIYSGEFEDYFEVAIIDGISPILSVEYSTTITTNKDVQVIIKANEEIQTVEGWSLSDNKLELTKTYTANGKETVTVYDLAGNSSIIEVNVNNIDKKAPELSADYTTKDITNRDVEVTINSNERVQEVEGWSLSDNKLELTKIYTVNGKETVNVYDIAGNKSVIEIKVENIDKTPVELEVEYSTTKMTNQNVTVTISANKEIQKVEGWTLSDNMKKLTKIYTEKGQEEIIVYDKAGNSKETKIEVNNIDKESPEATISYSNKEITNQNVEVTVVANEKIQEVEGWTLSEDEATLTKIYTLNKQEKISLYDMAGNNVSVQIKVENIDKVEPELEINYSNDLINNEVIATITANEKIQKVDGWKLSNDEITLTKTYLKNVKEVIEVYDLAGNLTKKTVEINSIVTDDDTVAQIELPKAGEKTLIFIGIIIGIVLMIVILLWLRVREFKDIK